MAEEKRSFLEPAVLARLMALPLHARQTMLGSVSGKHRSPVKLLARVCPVSQVCARR